MSFITKTANLLSALIIIIIITPRECVGMEKSVDSIKHRGMMIRHAAIKMTPLSTGAQTTH